LKCQNSALATSEHLWQEPLREAQDRFDVHPQHRYFVFDRDLPKFSSMAESGVVNEDVDVDTLGRQFIKNFLWRFGVFQIFRDCPHEQGPDSFQFRSNLLKL